MKRTWQNHAFWENYQKDRITGILVIEDDGKKTTQQLTVAKYQGDGSVNPDFQEIIDQLTEQRIDQNTAERHEKKTARQRQQYIQDQQKKNQAKLATLFEQKLQAFEIDEIKNSANRELKSRLRKSKNVFELQLYAQMIIKEQLGL